MIDIKQLQTIAQLVESMENISDKIEDSYNKNDGESFNQAKKDLLDIQKKISLILK